MNNSLPHASPLPLHQKLPATLFIVKSTNLFSFIYSNHFNFYICRKRLTLHWFIAVGNYLILESTTTHSTGNMILMYVDLPLMDNICQCQFLAIKERTTQSINSTFYVLLYRVGTQLWKSYTTSHIKLLLLQAILKVFFSKKGTYTAIPCFDRKTI